MGIKSYVKEWASEQWNSKVKNPIANKTTQLENSAIQQISTH